MEKYGGAREVTDDNIIRRMRFACWITKAAGTSKHARRICNIYCFSTATVVSGKVPHFTLYVNGCLFKKAWLVECRWFVVIDLYILKR